MQDLNIKYKTVLDNIKSSIQLSEELKTYLDTEEDEDYKALISKFEGEIHELYTQVADENPLQLESFESYLLDDAFEGLYLPKVLGYSVLRGRVSDRIKYVAPQNHFKKILLSIANSSNFDQIKQRVGQSIQIGFALSSDIWITNILALISNKIVHSFLESQKQDKYRDDALRNTGLVKYRKQFLSLNFQTTVFPAEKEELLLEAESIKDFLIFRANSTYNNENLMPVLREFVSNDHFIDMKEYYEICILTGLFYDLGPEGEKLLQNTLDHIRAHNPGANDHFFNYINSLYDRRINISIDSEKKLANAITRNAEDTISKYLNVMDEVNTKGYVHEDALTAVREFYYKNEGLSIENEALRNSILSKLGQLLTNLSVNDYGEYFEINKTFAAYMDIFSNQKFNQDLKAFALRYIKKCLKFYKDKRSKEYQDIKKFVKTTFVDFGFMTPKEIVELFKTKRKPRKVEK